MNRNRIYLVLLLIVATASAVAGDRRFILRPKATASANTISDRHNLSLRGSADDNDGKVFVVESSTTADSAQVLTTVSDDVEVASIEPDATVVVPEIAGAPVLNQSTTALLDGFTSPPALTLYFGQSVLNWYVFQPATKLIKLSKAQTMLALGSTAVVAVIDTGVDANHPALQGVLVDGYDFIRNQPGIPSEFDDLNPSAAALLSQPTVSPENSVAQAVVNQSTTALLDQSTTALLDTSQMPAAFGHGTMVAGLVHLAAPTAKIMPLKAFSADGTGQLSDILRAIHYAVKHGATVINMSFSLTEPSKELLRALEYAAERGVVNVASTGNSGQPEIGYPAAAPMVIAVASTSNSDVRSAFSSYGPPTWVAAPGEAVITTYPGNHYAAGWGTSFSTPLVSGAVALLQQSHPTPVTMKEARRALSHAKYLTPELGFGRLDMYRAAEEIDD
ncbi:MAG: S8 family serine peptidase [Terriglobales bacterium]